MFDKIKDVGAQALTRTGDALVGIADAVKEGAETVAGSINETAVKASVAQMRRTLEIAIQELESSPLANRPLTLTASVNVGVTSLELQVHLDKTAIDSPVVTVEDDQTPETTL